jgi:hypothetical protein
VTKVWEDDDFDLEEEGEEPKKKKTTSYVVTKKAKPTPLFPLSIVVAHLCN